MSSIKPKTVDTTALAAALLATAKDHLRVEWTYDDTYITGALRRAISWFERTTGVSVNKITWDWTPDIDDFCNGVAPLPVSPVNSFTAKDGNATDVSANYVVTTMSTHGVGLYALAGTWVTGLVVAIDSGYTDTTLPDGILDAVLRYAAHLYEHREILVPSTEAAAPDWTNSVISTYWMPRA